ncbi:MAG: BNR-4 repeat-containing protein, partial [Draconibacterium sp.]|nr:BNR-4 repeat-containing protein [Draconibacterium sp.]
MKLYITSILLFLFIHTSFSQQVELKNYEVLPFGEGGQIKMLYDRRQRPQSVFLNGKVHVVFNAGADEGATGQSKTKPMIVTYNPESRKFSEIVTLGKASKDHHYGPVIWADNYDYLHVLFGCHKTPGTHLISKKPGEIGTSLNDWEEAPEIAPSISYPTFYRIADNKELIYFRTSGHISSWTYSISSDNGKTWNSPVDDI